MVFSLQAAFGYVSVGREGRGAAWPKKSSVRCAPEQQYPYPSPPPAVCVCLFPSHAPLSFGQLSVPLAKICFAFVLIYFIAKCIFDFDFDFQLQVEDGVGDLNEVFFCISLGFLELISLPQKIKQKQNQCESVALTLG